jgi:photosystem II stability/assembly factor-like uncharacterized protein
MSRRVTSLGCRSAHLIALAALTVLPASAVAQSSHVGARATGPSGTPASLSAMRWRNVGPYIGGRVVAVTGVRGEPNVFYMGTVDGGIWKSTDYGLQWENLSDGALPGSSFSIGALAVAPSNHDVLYAGTGEADIRGDMITGDGVFRSDDAGKTWHEAGLADTHTTMGLVVDPRNPDVVYDASMGHVFVPGPNRGVFKTTDGGKTWKKTLFVNDSTGVVDLVMDPKNPDVLYAAAWQAYRTPWRLSSGGPGSGIYKTTDGGAHWTDISRSDGLPKGLLGKIGIGVSASEPNIVYATIQAKDGGVFRSEDGGGSWKRVNDEWKLRQRAFYYMAIFVDPKDPNTVYMPEVDALFVSHDGAKSFRALHPPHGDNHIVWINPDDPKILLEGNDGGATVSTDGGKTWSTEHNQPTGQFYSVDLDHRFPFHIYGAQQDEGSFEGPSASSQGSIPLAAWNRVAYGESTPAVPQPGDPDVNFGSGYFSIFLRYDQATGEYSSVSPWPHYQEGASAGELKYRFAWTHPILFSPVDSTQLFVGAQYVMKSGDYGQTWSVISPDLTRDDSATEAPTGGPIDLDQSGAEIYPYVSALAISPKSGDVIWAGSSDGLVHVTTDGGQHWKDVTPAGLPKWSLVSMIEPSHVDAATAYMTVRRYMWDDFTPYVFKTTDSGAHWTSITNGLPADDYAWAIAQDPREPDLLLLTTKTTVYVSLDRGSSWKPLSLNLPPVQVRDVAFDNREGEVVIATHGRAFWVLDNLSLLEQATTQPEVASSAPALFAPQKVWLTHAYGRPDRPRGGGTSGENPAFGATVFFHVPSSYVGKTPMKLTFLDSRGGTVRSFDLHLKEKASTSKDEGEQAAAAQTPAERKAAAQKRLTAIEPGMNSFQWDLRYTEATEVKGFHVPIAAGGLTDEVDGPVVTPGSYRVELDYGGKTMETSFDVALDPRLDATQADLEARLALRQKIQADLDALDRTINRAIDLRDSLESGAASGTRAGAVADLDAAIGSLVQMELHSSEGPLLHEAKLRSHLAYLGAELDMAYVKPTPAQVAVFRELDRQAHDGEKALESAMSKARSAR